MRPCPLPRAHYFVCDHVREGSPLGSGCGARGEAVRERLSEAVLARGLAARVWVTRSRCLGVCPPRGTTVALYGEGRRGDLLAEVSPGDVGSLLALAGIA